MLTVDVSQTVSIKKYLLKEIGGAHLKIACENQFLVAVFQTKPPLEIEHFYHRFFKKTASEN